MSNEKLQAIVDQLVRARFEDAAETYRSNLEQALHEALPGNHSPAQEVLLAHLMTTVDGYQNVKLVGEWRNRPRSGWGTALSYLPDISTTLFADFGLEVRHDDESRTLLVLLLEATTRERSPALLQRETALTALGHRVLAFTEREVMDDPVSVAEEIERVLAIMADEVLTACGIPH